ERDQLEPLVLEVDEGAFDAAAILARAGPAVRAGVARAPVVGPVDPRRRALADRALTAAAARGRLLDLAEEARAALVGDRAQPPLEHLQAIGGGARVRGKAARR